MYKKKVNHNDNKEIFNFLHDHFEYDTLNSWNGLKSVANNVKIHNLPVDYDLALQALEYFSYDELNWKIEDFERNNNVRVYFNGRSGGYLVMVPSDNNGHIFQNDIYPSFYDNYEEFKEDVKRDYGSLKNFHNDLVSMCKLVEDFDQLCDDLLEILKALIEQYKEEKANTHQWHATKKHEHYVYETLDDMKYHKEYMLQHGARLFDESEEYLYAEYEVDKYDEGEVVTY